MSVAVETAVAAADASGPGAGPGTGADFGAGAGGGAALARAIAASDLRVKELRRAVKQGAVRLKVAERQLLPFAASAAALPPDADGAPVDDEVEECILAGVPDVERLAEMCEALSAEVQQRRADAAAALAAGTEAVASAASEFVDALSRVVAERRRASAALAAARRAAEKRARAVAERDGACEALQRRRDALRRETEELRDARKALVKEGAIEAKLELARTQRAAVAALTRRVAQLEAEAAASEPAASPHLEDEIIELLEEANAGGGAAGGGVAGGGGAGGAPEICKPGSSGDQVSKYGFPGEVGGRASAAAAAGAAGGGGDGAGRPVPDELGGAACAAAGAPSGAAAGVAGGFCSPLRRKSELNRAKRRSTLNFHAALLPDLSSQSPCAADQENRAPAPSDAVEAALALLNSLAADPLVRSGPAELAPQIAHLHENLAAEAGIEALCAYDVDAKPAAANYLRESLAAGAGGAPAGGGGVAAPSGGNAPVLAPASGGGAPAPLAAAELEDFCLLVPSEALERLAPGVRTAVAESRRLVEQAAAGAGGAGRAGGSSRSRVSGPEGGCRSEPCLSAAAAEAGPAAAAAAAAVESSACLLRETASRLAAKSARRPQAAGDHPRRRRRRRKRAPPIKPAPF